MRSVPGSATLTATGCLIATVACGGERAPDAGTGGQFPAVAILSPADGDTVSQPFTLRLSLQGAAAVAATGLREEGRGHHHLLIDTDLQGPDLPIGREPGFIHIGTGADEWIIDSLAPGPHRIIAVFGYGDHVPTAAVASDTVIVVVR